MHSLKTAVLFVCVAFGGYDASRGAVVGSVAPRENAASAQTRTTSIAELQALAVSRSPAVAAIDQEIEASRGTTLQAGLPYNPTIGYDSDDVGAGGTAGKHGVVVSQEFLTGGKRTYAQTASRLETEALARRRDVVATRVANETRALAWKVLAARELATARSYLKRLADATENQAREFRRVGEISETSFLQLSVQAREADLAVVAAESRRTAAERELQTLLGGVGEIGAISDSLVDLLNSNEISEDVFLAQILAGSPQIQEANAFVAQKQAVVALERSKTTPNATVAGGVYYDAEGEQAVATAGVSVPLLVYDRNQGNIRRAQAEYVAAVRRAEQLRQDLAQRCAQVYSVYKTAREEALVYRDSVVPSLKKAYEMNFEAFQKAEIGYLEMSGSQVAYFESSAKYIEALQRLAEATALLDGMLL